MCFIDRAAHSALILRSERSERLEGWPQRTPGPQALSKLFHNFAKIVLDRSITKMQHEPNLLIRGDVSRADPEAKQGRCPRGRSRRRPLGRPGRSAGRHYDLSAEVE